MSDNWGTTEMIELILPSSNHTVNDSELLHLHLTNLLKDKSQYWYRVLFEYANLYLTPLIIIVGTSGNILSFSVFTCTYLKMKSSSVYLAALSMADTGFLLCLFFVWLSKVNIPIFQQPFWCQLIIYLNYVFNFLSVWSVVGFTGERYIYIYHALRKDRLCTRKTAKRVVCITVGVSLICYLFAFWTNGVEYLDSRAVCMPLPQYYDILTVLTGVDMLVSFLIPSTLIIVLNIKIMMKLHMYQEQSALKLKLLKDNKDGSTGQNSANSQVCNKRHQVVASVTRTGSIHFTFVSRSADDGHHLFQSSCSTQSHVNTVRKNISQYRTARIFILVSTVFLILNTPNHIFRMQAFVTSLIEKHSKSSKKLIIWQELFQLVYFLNFSVNFFIYSLCSRTFRSALKRLHQRCKRGKGEIKPTIVVNGHN